MRQSLSPVALLFAALLLAGCSGASNLLTGKSHVQQASNVPVGNSLTMPPDLSLAAPGQTTNTYAANPPPQPAPVQQMASAESDVYGGGAAASNSSSAAPQQDVYARYGISMNKPDGTRKKDWELREELRKAVVAERRKNNPNYGTIMNIGELFKDN
ncbi:MAG: hypothetical protein LCH46_06460 [Proteobacteria bacterium]|nr:hypothetical protein [Pseudomonadota bacterium]